MERVRPPLAMPIPETDIMDPRAREENAGRIVREYDAQGDHRTGSKVDALSARWLARWMGRCGVPARLDGFELDRIDPADCSIEIADRKITGLPAFDSGFTGRAGLSGKLGFLGDDCDIAVHELQKSGGHGEAKRQDAHPIGKHRAVIQITHGTLPGLVMANAPRFLDPTGIPTLQVSSLQADWLRAQAERGAHATFRTYVKRQKCKAYNLVGHVAGSNPELPPMIVSTPRSGWWNCASERAGGIFLWLEVLRRFREKQPARPCIFATFSGHELGLLGGRHFARSNEDRLSDAPVWLHFGANLGAPGMPVRLQSLDPALADIATPILTHNGVAVAPANNEGTPRGEAVIPRDFGIPYLAPIADSLVFHHPADRWPDAVDTALLARLGNAFGEIARVLAKP